MNGEIHLNVWCETISKRVQLPLVEIHILRNGQTFGPYSLDQAREYLASGNLVRSDLAWHNATGKWVPLDQIEGVAPSGTTAELPVWVPPRRDATTIFTPATTFPNTVRTSNSFGPDSATVPALKPTQEQIAMTQARQQTYARSDPYARQQRTAGIQNMLVGGVFFGGGIAVTVLTYESAGTSHGGIYLLAWGPMLFGVVRFITGFMQCIRG